MKKNLQLDLLEIKKNITEANQTFVDISRRNFLKKTFLVTGGLLIGSKVGIPAAMAATSYKVTNFSFSHPSGAASSAVTFSWDPVTGAQGYRLYYKSTVGASWALLADVGNVTSKTFSVVPAGAYYLCVAGYAGSYEAEKSDTINCYISFPSPTFLSNSVSASGTLTLTWNAVTGAAGYFLYVGTSATGPFSTQVNLGNVTIKRFPSITPGTYYAYFTPYNSQGTKGSNSTITTVIVPAR